MKQSRQKEGIPHDEVMRDAWATIERVRADQEGRAKTS